MPYISCKISKTLTDAEKTALKAGLGKAITAIPGKSETYLMVSIEDGCDLWLAGKNDSPLAMLEVKILGHAKAADFDKMTGVICKLLEGDFGIPAAGVYVAYSEFEHWGWNGHNF